MKSRLTPAPQRQMSTQAATTPAPQTAARSVPSSSPSATGDAFSYLARAQPRQVLQAEVQVRAERQTHLEIAERLAPIIQPQVAEVLAVLEAEGLGPDDVQMLFAFDTNGDEKVVCAFCGREGCGYRPVKYQTKNVEIDLIEDAFVASAEIARKAGIQWGAVIYDQDVLVLREILAAKDGEDQQQLLSRWRAFVDRHQYPDPANRAWLDERLAQWRPEHATTSVQGKANDKGLFDVAKRLFTKGGKTQGKRGIVLTKSQVPESSLRAQEALMKAQKVGLHGLAVGKVSSNIVPLMFRSCEEAPDAHAARESVGRRVALLVRNTKKVNQ